MDHRIAKLTESLRRIGEIEVTDWDFAELLHRDVEDLEVTRALRRLGRMRVTEWDFKDVLPAVNRLARKEVDLVDAFRRAAAYRVMEWDFRNPTGHHDKTGAATADAYLSPEEMQALIQRLKSFLGFVAGGLTEYPEHARITVTESAPTLLRFRLILVKRDAAMLIGHGGHTAAAIRRIMQGAGTAKGVNVLLNILTHEEAAGS